MKKQLIAATFLTLFSTLAMAHPGHAGHGVVAGFLHPFTGLDHVLVMLAIGLWAGRLGGTACWQLPLTFVLTMAIGVALGMAGMYWPVLETGIAASVMAMGVLLVIHTSLSRPLQLGLTAVFALMHGASHGAELSFTTGLGAAFGMLLATALLHALGLAISLNMPKRLQVLYPIAGSGMLLAGFGMLAY